jgi:dTDP-4-dehydrorhamnose 3,5-epimerase-like enzyme
MTDVSACTLLNLPKITDNRGNLTFIENLKHIPFSIKRMYYLYDVPAGEARGGHAHRTLEQFIISANGSFDVVLHDGFSQRTVHLNRPFFGLYIPPMIWRELNNFSSGSVCIVLASDIYRDEDYLRDFDVFKNLPR